MGYVGNTPAEKYASFAVQNFTVTATTNYTLDHPVANENDIRLVINNVVQHPGSGKAYTASGTTLTLSEATAGTDTMYCVFLGKAVQTVTPSNSSVTNAMLVADSVNGDKIADDSISDEHLDITAITGQTEKTSLADADKFLISDSAASGALKYVQKSNLGAGGLVLVGSVTDDSGSSVITLDNIFSSTYKSYLIQVTRLVPSSAGANIEFLFRDSSSADLSANYGYASRTLKANDGSESTRNGDSQSYVTITTAGIGGVNNNTTGQGLRMSLFVADPYASEQTGYHGNFSNLDSGGYGIAGYLGGIHQANSSVRGFKFRPSTGTISKATIRVYGLVSS